MINTANLPLSLGLPLGLGLLLGLLIFADPYISASLHLKALGVDSPFVLSLSIFISFIVVFILAISIKKLITLDRAKTFIVLYIVGLQTMGLSPIPKLDGSNLVILGYLTVFFVSSMVEQRDTRITTLDFLNLCFLFTLFLSLVNGNIGSGLGIITAIFVSISTFLIINLCSKDYLLRFLIKSLLVVTTLSAIFAIFQEAVFIFTGTCLTGFIEKEEFRHMFETNSLGTFFRVSAFTSTYAFFAQFLVTSIVIGLNILLYFLLNRKQKILLSIALGLMFIALILTFSRYSLLALFVIIPIILFVRWPRYSLHFVSLFMLSVIMLYMSGYYKDLFDMIVQEIKWGEFRIRLQVDREGIYGFLYQHPWVGAGVGKSGEYASHFYGWGAHNNFIRVAGDTGILGLIPYCLIISYSLIRAIVINLRVHDPVDKGMARGLLFSLCTLLIMMQFDSVYLAIYLWFLMSVIMAADLVYAKNTGERIK